MGTSDRDLGMLEILCITFHRFTLSEDTGKARLIQSHSLARFSFEISGIRINSPF